jgi:hypothetical protein
MILGLTFHCFSNHAKTEQSKNQTGKLDTLELSKSKKEIQQLIRQVILWSDSKESIELLTTIPDANGRVYIGFDMDQHTENLIRLKETKFFANEFVENYNRIILTLDRKIRNKEFEEWLVSDLPPFHFVNDVSPWCICQGFSPEDFDDVEIVNITSKSGKLIWKWKKGSSWTDFKFRVKKEDNKWRISYMEGFDFKRCTQ